MTKIGISAGMDDIGLVIIKAHRMHAVHIRGLLLEM